MNEGIVTSKLELLDCIPNEDVGNEVKRGEWIKRLTNFANPLTQIVTAFA